MFIEGVSSPCAGSLGKPLALSELHNAYSMITDGIQRRRYKQYSWKFSKWRVASIIASNMVLRTRFFYDKTWEFYKSPLELNTDSFRPVRIPALPGHLSKGFFCFRFCSEGFCPAPHNNSVLYRFLDN